MLKLDEAGIDLDIGQDLAAKAAQPRQATEDHVGIGEGQTGRGPLKVLHLHLNVLCGKGEFTSLAAENKKTEIENSERSFSRWIDLRKWYNMTQCVWTCFLSFFFPVRVLWSMWSFMPVVCGQTGFVCTTHSTHYVVMQ